MNLPPHVRRAFVAEVFFTCQSLFDAPPELCIIESWSDTEVKAVLDWAQAEYLIRQIDSMMPRNNPQPAILHAFNGRNHEHGPNFDGPDGEI